MKIGIIGGTGPQGLGIAKRLAIAGEDVIVGSRKEEKALTVVEEANEEIKEYNPKELVGMANEDAAAAADVLILTVPLQAQSATLKTIKEHTKGKVLLDATVPGNSYWWTCKQCFTYKSWFSSRKSSKHLERC